MNDESPSTERQRNLWAPWRMEYIDALSAGPDGSCFLCNYGQSAEEDRANLVLWRGQHSFVVMNRFPYTGGHCMIAPYDHVADLAALSPESFGEMFAFLRDTQQVLSKAIGAEGFNIGINIGRCAGAGLPGHLHVHIVPRWGGDTNFMAVFGGVRVVPQSLEATYDKIVTTASEMHLPKTPS